MSTNINSATNLDNIDLGKEIIPSKAPVGCEKCNWSGLIRYMDNGYAMSKPCECYTSYQISKRQKESSIPEKYKFSKLDIEEEYKLYKFNAVGYNYSTDIKTFNFTADKKTYDVNKVGERFIERATGFLRENPRQDCLSLLISGRVGSGKTKVACAIANSFLEKGLKAYYIKASHYVTNVIQDGFKDEKKKELRDFLNCANINDDENCHLLILDELGEESLNGDDNNFASQEIRKLLKSRTEKLYPTIITTNFNPAELPKYYKEDTISMLCEDFMFFLLMGSNDYRVRLNNALDKKLGLDDF